jgi:hypothetical protein
MMVLSSLVALAAAQRFFQAPAPGSVPMAAAYAVPNMAPVPGAFPSVTVAATSSAAPSRSPALSIAAGAALGATVAVLFGSGKKAAAKKTAAKPAAKKPAAKPAAKKAAPAKKPAVSRAAQVRAPAAKKSVSAPRRAPVQRSGRYDGSARGKGGIFPWIQNEPGTYAKPLMLSRIDFTSDDGDRFVGWGGMPQSVKNLYNPNGRKGLLGGCITPAK